MEILSFRYNSDWITYRGKYFALSTQTISYLHYYYPASAKPFLATVLLAPKIFRDNRAFSSKLRYVVNCHQSARMRFLLPSSYEGSEKGKSRRSRKDEGLEELFSIGSFPFLSLFRITEIARCQNFLIRHSGTAEQSVGTNYEREREREGERKARFYRISWNCIPAT